MTASLTKTIRHAGLMLAFAVSVSALSSTSSFAFSAEAQQMCTGDAFRLCSLRNTEHSGDHRLHGQEQGQSERRLQGGDGQGSGQGIRQGRGQVIQAGLYVSLLPKTR